MERTFKNEHTFSLLYPSFFSFFRVVAIVFNVSDYCSYRYPLYCLCRKTKRIVYIFRNGPDELRGGLNAKSPETLVSQSDCFMYIVKKMKVRNRTAMITVVIVDNQQSLSSKRAMMCTQKTSFTIYILLFI